jgi:hypothetical protein
MLRLYPPPPQGAANTRSRTLRHAALYPSLALRHLLFTIPSQLFAAPNPTLGNTLLRLHRSSSAANLQYQQKNLASTSPFKNAVRLPLNDAEILELYAAGSM